MGTANGKSSASPAGGRGSGQEQRLPQQRAGGDTPSLLAQLLAILELKGFEVEQHDNGGIRAAHSTFRDFTDSYYVDLVELPSDEEVAEPEWEGFLERMEGSGLERAVLVTNQSFNAEIAELARQAGNVALFRYDELLADLIDFRPYLRNVVSAWESDPLHPGNIVIPAQASPERDGERFALDAHVDRWLDEPGRDPLFVLGRYGSGKTTFVKSLAARLAHAYLRDPVRNRVPILVPLREYSSLVDMDELIVARLAELAPDQAPPSRHAFRLLLEAGRFCLILDGLDELVRRLEENYVLKNFDKLTALVLPGAKTILTAREGYLGTPEDEAQIMGLQAPLMASPQQRPPLRFERLYLQPIDAQAIDGYVRKRFPERADHYKMVLSAREEMVELAHTPLLLELMLQALPQLEGRLQINPAVVMSAFINSWAELGRSRRPMLQSAEDAIYFATEVAWQMHWGGVYKIHFTELGPSIRARFRDRILANDAPDPFLVDLQDCPFLRRGSDGTYAFVQNAFLDFLAALAYMRYLLEHGTAPVDSRRTNPDMQRFVRDLATMDERYLKAYYGLLDDLRKRDDPTQWLFYRDLLPYKEKVRIYAAERERVRELQSAHKAPQGMVYVPPGDFLYGSFEHRDEAPVRRLTLPGFFIDEHPVTNAEYLAFLEQTDHPRPLWTEDTPEAWIDGRPRPGTEQLPVTKVSFEDAMAFATWAGKRLPTEQEWELAARGYEGRRYPWGDHLDPLAVNGALEGPGGVMPVGRHPEGASVFGCQDMSGNVWEWTNSRYDKYQALKILRGGSFRANPDELRAANRMFWDPEFPKPDIGFRCVESATEMPGEKSSRADRRRGRASEDE